MLRELAIIFLRLGATAFGGPLAHIALMRTEFVDKRAWLSEQEFLDLNGAVNLIPGPNSTELAMHIGYKRAGMAGLWVAGACFIAPAMIFVLVLAHLYARFGTLPASRAILWGVSPVVVAIVVQALWKFAPGALKNRRCWIVASAALLAVILGASEILVIFAAALLGLVFARFEATSSPHSASKIKPSAPKSAFILMSALPASTSAIFWTFLKMGCVVYGSGYVLLAYLRAELVEKLGWISSQQLVDAIAVGQVTPGPVFTTATFIGYQIGGLSGALAATAGIFGPSFLFVAILATGMEQLIASLRARVFLDVVNAASLALMSFVTFELARGAVWNNGKFDFWALLLGVGAAILLLRTKINSAWLLGAGALIGLMLKA